MSKLFDNVGKDLKKLAEGMAALILIVFCIIGLLVMIGGGILAYEYDIPVIIAIILGAIFFGIGYIVSKLSAIRLYAFGELVERVCSLEEKVVGTSKETNKKNGKNNADATITEKRTKKASLAHVAWVCPFCDHMNPPGAPSCQECGAEYNCWEETPR